VGTAPAEALANKRGRTPSAGTNDSLVRHIPSKMSRRAAPFTTKWDNGNWAPQPHTLGSTNVLGQPQVPKG
jgi:hypothetical protein